MLWLVFQFKIRTLPFLFDLFKLKERAGIRGQPQYLRNKGEGMGQAKCVRVRRWGVSRFCTYAKKIVFDHKISTFLFCTKVIPLPFIIVYRKV